MFTEGCGGFVYKFKFDSAVSDEDLVYQDKERIVFVTDVLTMKFIKGCVIDHETEMMRQSFFVNI